jgi:ribosomal-protein-alanine N-acetyltransferase
MDVTVAPVSADDGAAFVAAVRASRELHHPWIDPPDSAERFEAWLERLCPDDQEAYLIRHGSCGELVGYVSVSNIVRRAFQSAQLGYGAFASHAGRGLMTQGLGAVIQICFQELGLHRLKANIQPTNQPSLAIVRKLGFEKEGYSPRYLMVDSDWRDHERWAIRTETWYRSPIRAKPTAQS